MTKTKLVGVLYADLLDGITISVPTEKGKTMTELKPCPFCGGTAIINYPAHNIAEVLCSRWSCRASISMGGERSLDKVIERWNRRAEDGK